MDLPTAMMDIALRSPQNIGCPYCPYIGGWEVLYEAPADRPKLFVFHGWHHSKCGETLLMVDWTVLVRRLYGNTATVWHPTSLTGHHADAYHALRDRMADQDPTLHRAFLDTMRSQARMIRYGTTDACGELDELGT